MRSPRRQRSPNRDDERRTAEPAPQQHEPAPDPNPLAPDSVLALQRTTGNAALASVQAWPLTEQGIDPGRRGGVTESRWKAQQELAKRETELVGKVGKVELSRGYAWVRVGSYRIPMAYRGAGYADGDTAEMAVLSIQRHFATADADGAKWDDDEKFEAVVRRVSTPVPTP